MGLFDSIVDGVSGVITGTAEIATCVAIGAVKGVVTAPVKIAEKIGDSVEDIMDDWDD